jgi:hypothetical protein
MTKWSAIAILMAVCLLAAAPVINAQDNLVHLSTQDYIDLQQLYARYNMAIDTSDAEAWAATFTPDGVFNNTNRGHDGLVQFIKDWREKRNGAMRRHWNSNLTFTATNTGARGSAYLILLDISVRPAAIALTGIYEDVIVRTPQGWRFQSRVVHLDPAPSVVAK